MSLKIDRVELEIVIKNDESRKRLREIDEEMRLLSKDLKKLPKDTQEWIDKSEQLKKLKTEYDKIYDTIGLTGLSLKELKRRQQELISILNNVPGDSPLYKKYNDQLDQVKGRIKELKGTAQETHFSLGKMADGFNRYFAMFTAFTASIAGVVLGFKSLKEERDKLEDSKANLKALTGLDQKDVDRLTEMAKKMAVNPLEGSGIRIRQSVQEIVDAYTKVGSQKPELLKDADALNEVTKQALILATAAKMEVVPASEGLTNVMNQYGVSAKNAAHFMNVLAAGSQAGAKEVPYISEAMTKFGSVAKLANVPVEQAVALIETLGEKGHAAEISGTGLKTFFVKLMQGADETNPKVVGMSTALGNLNKKFSTQGGFSEMVKLFGQENVVIAQTLISQRNRFEELTQAVTGTSTGIEQAAINSQTPAAIMAQSINKMKLAGIELVDKLQPAISGLTGWFSKTVQVLPGLVDWFIKWGGTIVGTTVIIAAYTVAIKAQTLMTKAATLWNEKFAESFGKIFQFLRANPWATALAGLVAFGALINGIISKHNELRNTIKDTISDASKSYREQTELEKAQANGLFEAYKSANVGTEERRIALEKIKSLYGSYIQNLIDEKGNIKDIARAQEQVNTALEKNIILKVTEEAKNKILEKSISDQTDILTEMEERMSAIKGENGGSVFADQISSIFRQYSSDLNKAEEMATALAMKYSKGQGLQFHSIMKDRISQYKTSLAVQQKGLDELDKKFNRVLPKSSSNASSNVSSNNDSVDTNVNNGGDTVDDINKAAKKALDKKLKDEEDAWKKKQAAVKERYAFHKITEEQFLEEMDKLEMGYLNGKLATLKKAGQNTGDVELEIATKRVEINDRTLKSLQKKADELSKTQKEAAERNLKILETQEAGEISLLDAKRNKNLITESAYQAELLKIEVSFLEKKLKLAGLSAEKIEEFKKQIIENGTKGDDLKAKDRTAFTDKYGSEEEKLTAWKKKEEEILKDYLKRGIINEEEAAKAKEVLDREYNLKKLEGYSKAAQEISNIAGNLSSAAQGFQQAEEMSVNRKYAKLIKAAGKNQKQVTKLEEQKEQELADIRKKWADKQFILTVAMIVAQTAVAAISAYASAVKVPIVGPVLAPIAAAAAVMAGGAQLAVANQARQQAKEGLYKGGYSQDYVSGYTESGNPREEAGVISVHKNEFVGNHKGVGNPHVKQFYDIFNMAQKSGRISMLNTTEILDNLKIKGLYQGGYTNPQKSESRVGAYATMADLNMLAGVLSKNADALDRLNQKMDTPLKASVSVTGKDGINEQQALYDRMIANKSRG